ncbi:MAG: hypothetical protein IT166_15365 [Bryobacterales bacterium]|nr:hypothetical protein [Bryobacterales bacterium]
MQAYSAFVLLLTAAMVVLHVFEWRAVPSLVNGAGAPGRNPQMMRRAIQMEGLYYLAILPILYAVPNSVTRNLLAAFAVYHWGGAVLLEATGFWRKENGGIRPGARRMVTWSLAALDVAEVVLLISFGAALYASNIGGNTAAAV